MLNKFFLITIFNFFYLSFSVFASSNDDIKWNRWPIIDFNNYILYQFIIIWLLVLLLLYNQFVVNKKNIEKTILDENLERKKILVSSLKKLKKNIESSTKSIFYSELNWYFRDYFSILEIKNSDTLTLKELKQMWIDNDLVNLYEKSYLNEFNDKWDLPITRLEIIDKLIKIIK